MSVAVSRFQAEPGDKMIAEASAGIGDDDRTETAEPVARDTTGRMPDGGQPPLETVQPSEKRIDAVKRFARSAGKHVATLAIALVAILVSLLTWQHYVSAPWTRNGSVRVQVANVAPQVSGKIVELRVADNQFVHKGDVLYVIDPFDFEVAVRVGKATVDQRAADLQVKEAESTRRQRLSDLATTPEEQQIFAGNAVQAKAAYEAAAHQLAQADLNLTRTKVVSPVDGYVTNLLLRVGDYAVTGNPNISVIDSDSFWIDGYFEETKMANVCVGDRAEAQLMGYAQPIVGHVRTVTRGVSVSNATAGTQGLPNVDPIYTWVRLAQRVPVRVAIDTVPAGVPLVSGMTATVTIRQPVADKHSGWFSGVRANIVDPLSNMFSGGLPTRPDCLQDTLARTPAAETIPYSNEPPIPSPDKVVPGLTPRDHDVSAQLRFSAPYKYGLLRKFVRFCNCPGGSKYPPANECFAPTRSPDRRRSWTAKDGDRRIAVQHVKTPHPIPPTW